MPTQRQIIAAKRISENLGKTDPETLQQILLAAGYSKSVAETPSMVLDGKGFQALMDEYLPDEKLAEVHRQLLNTTKIEHMVFPLGPKHNDEIPLEGDIPEGLLDANTDKLSDDDIREMIAEVGCKVRKIAHGETARHVWFWAPDAANRKAAVELAYRVKGKIVKKIDGTLKIEAAAVAVEELANQDDNVSKWATSELAEITPGQNVATDPPVQDQE